MAGLSLAFFSRHSSFMVSRGQQCEQRFVDKEIGADELYFSHEARFGELFKEARTGAWM